MKKTDKFFIDIISSYISDRALALPDNVNYAKLMHLAYIHKLTPVVYSALAKFRDRIPPDVFDALKSAALTAASSQVSRSRAFCEKYALITGEGIRCAVVKGIALRRLWREGDLRTSTDEDILVDPSDFRRAAAILSESGMEEKDAGANSDVRTFVCPESGLAIELHRKLIGGVGELKAHVVLLFGNSLSNLTEFDVDGCKLCTLSPTDHLLYLILHSFKHFISCGFGVRQVADFIVFAREYAHATDADYIVRSLRSLRALGFFDCLLKICGEYFGVTREELGFSSYTPSDTDSANMIEDIISAGAYGNSTVARAHSAVITLSSVDSGKTRSPLSAVFPPYSIMKGSYPILEKHRFLLPAAWVKRIVTKGFAKKTRNGATETLETGRRRTAMLRQYGVIK